MDADVFAELTSALQIVVLQRDRLSKRPEGRRDRSGPHRTQRYKDADVIAELTSAVQNFVLHRTRPREGIMIEARQLANQWKLKGRPLFDSSTQDQPLLLAALVVACRKDQQLIELIRRHRPEEFNKLITESFNAEVEEIAPRSSGTPRILTAKQRYEHKRSKRNRAFSKSIEHQFGASLVALLDWQVWALPLLGPTAKEDMVRRSQTCLDDIFKRGSVNTLKLEELFWMDRHRFAKPLRGFHTGPFNYLAVTKIMDFLLKEKRRLKRKRSTPGRSPRVRWLDNRAVRVRVLSGIEARINSLPIERDIASAFLTVIRAHLPESGKK